jgi:hypothetical protein
MTFAQGHGAGRHRESGPAAKAQGVSLKKSNEPCGQQLRSTPKFFLKPSYCAVAGRYILL